MSIKFKLIISYLILIIFTVGVLGLLIGKKSKDAVFNEVTEKGGHIAELINSTVSVRNDLLVEKSYSDINFAMHQLNDLGDISVDYNEIIKVGDFLLPSLYAGKEPLSLANDVIANIKKSTGTKSTIFLLYDNKLIRISTDLVKKDQLAVGTFFDSDSVVYKKIVNKEEYCGLVTFEGENYISRIKPLLDKNKRVVGAIALGSNVLNSYLEKTLSDIKIGKTGYVYVIDSNGTLILHPEDKGTNASQYDFVKKIIETKKGTVEYEYKGVHKLAFYRYFEPWNWYIVTTANYDDLESSSKAIFYTTLSSGLVIIIFGALIALIITKNLIKPINKLKTYMEIAGKGDLSVRSDINSKDEIGILSNSFNNMIAENKRLLEETVKYDKLKTEFIANMSHELRTPLNIIFSTSQLFSLYTKKGESLNNSDKINKYISIIKQNCYRLLRLVNNLIDITKIDSGFMELNLKNENIVEVVEEITLSTAEYVKSMSRTIIFDTDIEEKIMAFDEEKMERILLNLISNAIKFTSPGGLIEVSIYDKDTHIIISVKDNGKGIPADKLTQIFERFKQVDSLLSRSHEGSGIGLAIVKSLVELQGGKISVKSNIKEGTEFIITLPVNIIPDNDNDRTQKSLINQTNVEKIQIEFSDIYS